MWTLALQQVANGLVIGSMYALMSIGMMLILGIMSVINMSHGEFYMLGGMICFSLVEKLGMNYFVALPFAAVSVALIGLVAQQVVVRPLDGRPWHTTFLTTFGLSMILRDVAQIIWGADPLEVPSPLARKKVVLGEIFLTQQRIFILVSGVALIGVLYVFIRKNRVGIAMRAMVRDREAAAMMGINTGAINRLTFGLGAATAAFAGALLGGIFNVFPTMGELPLVKAFAVVIMGGMGNVQGILFSGLILGVSESLAASFISLGYADAISFALLITVLLFRPQGLFGKKV